MANMNSNPESEAKKWFTLAVIGTLLYATTVFVFVITADPGASGTAPAKVQANGQSH